MVFLKSKYAIDENSILNVIATDRNKGKEKYDTITNDKERLISPRNREWLKKPKEIKKMTNLQKKKLKQETI